MQKLLVSDYDGTFREYNNELESIEINKLATKEFMSRNNLFAFATGRNFNSIINECKKYNLDYHFLICNNGTSIFNKNKELIHSNLIAFASVIKTIRYLNRKNVILAIKYLDIFGNKTDNFCEVAEIVCTVNIPTPEKLEEVKNELSFLQTLYFTSGNSQLHTISADNPSPLTQYLVIKEPADKKDAIKFIASSTDISNSNIYTIGNDFNDYGMLECYNGYKMVDSRSELELLDVPEVSSVKELIKRIEG